MSLLWGVCLFQRLKVHEVDKSIMLSFGRVAMEPIFHYGIIPGIKITVTRDAATPVSFLSLECPGRIAPEGHTKSSPVL